MAGIDDLLALEIDEALCPFTFSFQDIARARADGRIAADEAIWLAIGTLAGATLSFEERLNKLEGKPEGIRKPS